MSLLPGIIMNKSLPITGFIFSWARRVSSSLSYSPNLPIRLPLSQCSRKVLIPFSPVAHNVRGISGVPTSPREEKYKQMDKIPDTFNLIYRSPMSNYVLFTQCVCCSSTVVGVLACGYNFFTSNVWQIDTEFITFGSLLVGFNISTLYLILQYIMRIYVSDDKYICVMPSFVPFRYSHLMYTIGDVKHVPPTGHLPWRYNRYKIYSKSVIILEHYFRRPSDYNSMMGRL